MSLRAAASPIQFGVSATLLALALWMAEDFLGALVGLDPYALGIATALLIGNSVFIHLRFHYALKQFGMGADWRETVRTNVLAQCVAGVGAAMAGQVGVRAALMRKHGLSIKDVALLTVYERIVGMAVLGTMAVPAAAYLWRDAALALASDWWWAIAAAVVIGVPSAVVALKLMPTRWRLAVRKYGATRYGFIVVAQTAALRLLMTTAFVTLAAATSTASWVDLFAAATVTFALGSVPLGLNGWGVHQLAAVTVMPAVGVPGDAAVAASVAVGLIALAIPFAQLPATWWLAHGKESRPKPVCRRCPADSPVHGQQ